MEIGFTLKKIISAFLMPLPIGLIILAVGLLYLYSQNHKKAKIYLSISFVWIFLVGYSPFANAILNPLETKYPIISKDISVKYILLLGGDYENRGSEAIRLYHLIKGSKIITSGFENAEDIPEAVSNAIKLVNDGIPKEDILMETRPKDTQEEAIYIKKIVGDEPFILVTAAYHMPRAISLFKKHGLNPIAAPTFFLTKKNRPMLLPNSGQVFKSEVAFHEYLGLTWNIIKEYKKKIIGTIEE